MQMSLQQGQQPSVQPISAQRELHIAFRGAVALLLFTGFILYRLLLLQPTTICIYDAYQTATLKANRQLVVDPNSAAFQGNSNQLNIAGQAFIGTGQVMMDLWILIFGLIWLVKVKNARGMGALAGFFLIRASVFLNIQKFPYPDNIVWRSPGFFSFTVPYDHTRDFFFSGHTGTLTAIFLEMAILRLRWVAVVAFLCLIFMMNMLIITQVHYVCDIMGGLIFATWFHRTATRIVLWMDKALSFPFFASKWVYQKTCRQYCTDAEGSTDGQEAKNKREYAGGTQGRFHAIQIESRKGLQGQNH